jgi:hypothetical protein
MISLRVKVTKKERKMKKSQKIKLHHIYANFCLFAFYVSIPTKAAIVIRQLFSLAFRILAIEIKAFVEENFTCNLKLFIHGSYFSLKTSFSQ